MSQEQRGGPCGRTRVSKRERARGEHRADEREYARSYRPWGEVGLLSQARWEPWRVLSRGWGEPDSSTHRLPLVAPGGIAGKRLEQELGDQGGGDSTGPVGNVGARPMQSREVGGLGDDSRVMRWERAQSYCLRIRSLALAAPGLRGLQHAPQAPPPKSGGSSRHQPGVLGETSMSSVCSRETGQGHRRPGVDREAQSWGPLMFAGRGSLQRRWRGRSHEVGPWECGSLQAREERT